MLQLVYISTSRQPLSSVVLNQILESSRRNNRAVNVSGLLVAGGRRFLQALEGGEREVLATFSRIEKDPRHFALVTLSRRPVERRQFGDWAMGYHEGGPRSDETNLLKCVESLTACIDDATLRAQFRGFAELHSRAA